MTKENQESAILPAHQGLSETDSQPSPIPGTLKWGSNQRTLSLCIQGGSFNLNAEIEVLRSNIAELNNLPNSGSNDENLDNGNGVLPQHRNSKAPLRLLLRISNDNEPQENAECSNLAQETQSIVV